MSDELLRLARQAIWRAMQDEGVPGTLGKADGTILAYKPDGSAYSDRCWARVGSPGHLTEIVVMLHGVARSPGLPVMIADRNGRPTAIGVDRSRIDIYYGGRGGGGVEPHAWTHGRYGSDPLYVTGGMFVPLMARPTEPPSMAVTVEGGWYRYLGTLTRWSTADSPDLSGYVPSAASNPNLANHHFVVLCLDRSSNALVVVDGAPVAPGAPVGTCPFSATDVAAVSIAAAYWPLAAIWFPQSMTEIRANHIFLDLRLWGGEHLNLQIAGLDDLGDVDTSGVADEDALLYDVATGTWLPVDIATQAELDAHEALANPHSTALDDLSDVETAGVADGDALVYDSALSDWVPGEAGGRTQIEAEAGVNLAAGDVVNLYDNTGVHARLADATLRREAHGYVDEAYTAGQTATVYMSGVNEHMVSRTPGATQFLGDAGTVLETAPTDGIVQEVGQALGTASMIFRPNHAVTLAT